MSERDAFIRSICEQPADDVARLVFADWLDEHGDEAQRARAEFIRVQCESAVCGLSVAVSGEPTHKCIHCAAVWRSLGGAEAPEGGWSLSSSRCGPCCDNAPMGDQIVKLTDRESALLRRELELLGAWSREWFRGAIPGARVSHWSAHSAVPYFVLPAPNGYYANIEIRRGFIDSVSISIDAFAGDGVPCAACERGAVDWETGIVECRQCDSIGFVYGPVAEELFTLHPLRVVELENAAPGQYGNTREWFWARRPLQWNRRVRYAIPDELFDLLPGRVHTDSTPAKHFATKEDAVAALAQVAVSHGRKLAGLPPLAAGAAA